MIDSPACLKTAKPCMTAIFTHKPFLDDRQLRVPLIASLFLVLFGGFFFFKKPCMTAVFTHKPFLDDRQFGVPLIASLFFVLFGGFPSSRNLV